ncbi:hypothetical protein L1049_016365 [Liquidambar formosana]|uniref:F-box domain-containing protein n=1 Tax=Liquidambar formosana TaxID=63359 RepID=A0AAP0X7H3_LIQFO
MPTLPHKIIVHILSRLPVKSLCRFRCVSKPWRTIISEPHFAKTHLDRTQHERLILIDGEIYTVEDKQSSSDNVAMAVELNFPCLKSPIEWIGILGSCDDEDEGEDVCSESIVSVYTLRTNNSWRRIEDNPFSQFVHDLSHMVFLNGALHCNGYRCDVCVMKEYGVRESWTKFTITVPDVTVEPLWFPNSGEIMWVCGGKLNVYNPNGKTFRDVVIRGIPAPFEVGIYVESIVSPNYSSRIDTIAASQVQDNPNAMTNVKSSRCHRQAAPTDLPARKGGTIRTDR